MDGRDDRALLEAHVAGDETAFPALFSRHRDRLWAVALRTTGSPDDAADALQDAMISAFRRAGSYRGDAQVTTWLHRIVVNACLDRMRRAKVRAADPLPDDLDERAARGDVLVADDASDPARAAEQSDLRAQLLAALEDLPPDQRAAVVLVDVQGYPVEEAARILECPTGTIKSRCSRGRARLAAALGHLAPGADDETGDETDDKTGPDGTEPRSPASQHSGPAAPSPTEEVT